MPLTDTAIRNTKPSDKPVRMFDGGGLYLEVAPSGGKWWRYKYRFEGKEKRLSLGVYPEVGLKEARIRHADMRKLLAHGTDPGATRKALKAAGLDNSSACFEAVAREWWASHMASKAATHKDKVIRRFELYLHARNNSIHLHRCTSE